jgi:molybdopterin converting factor small subunit
MATVTLRYWAAAKQAAGVAEETISADTLGDALAAALQAREQTAAGAQADSPARLRTVLARSSFLVDGNPVGGRAPESVLLEDAAVVEVLPPFAGG